jgi:2-polyprenyl-3-methyl-5-hydroxy-6-metoxy-1,4-benzoquinol methylase
MSYWENVWSRATTNGIFKSIHDVAEKHSSGLMDKHVFPFASELKTICELGSGSGTNSMYIASKLPGARVTLVDTNATILQVARAAFEKAGIPMEPRNVDMFTMDTSDRYDIVHSGGLLEHFTNPVDVLNLHLALTRKGGIVFISIPRNCWWWNGFLLIMRLRGEFNDQKNYSGKEFAAVVKAAYKANPCFKVESFSSDGIDIAITLRKTR